MADESEKRQDQPDDSAPSPERQAELRAAYEANVKLGKPPYAGVIIHTRGELLWIARERDWRMNGFATYEDRIDLRRVGFAAANLQGVALTFADLREVGADDADFSLADLTSADLSGAVMEGTSFRGAELVGANLSGARFIGPNQGSTNFRDANLSLVDLSGTLIRGDLRGANLWRARMDAATILGTRMGEVQLDASTRLLDVSWSGADLASVNWDTVPRLGDEAIIKGAKTRHQRVEALRDTARAYQGLAKALQAQGLTIPALRYRAREHQLERQALRYSFALGPWLFSWLLNIVSGYGDRPGRALACYLAVVGAFTGAYWAVTNQVLGLIQSHSAHLAWYEALVLSISSFHGRGFFPSTLSLGDPIALVAAAEAIIGLFIELVFIATFTQRFFAR